MSKSHSFYDELRATDPENVFPVVGGNDHVGRNLHKYNCTASGAGGEDSSSIIMCHVPPFMRYTAMDGVGH